MPKNVIVVGMPRSGTSLTMAIFARKGYYVGPVKRDRYREGDEHNPFGYFEADAIVKRNAALFERLGFPHHNTWLFDRINPQIAERILYTPHDPIDRELVESYKDIPLWAWKDPRLTYTLGYWWRLMDPEAVRVILCWREPEDVKRSFERMGWAVQPDLIERVREHWEAAHKAIVEFNIPHVLVNYTDYLEEPMETAARISKLLDLDVSESDLNVREELNHAASFNSLSAFARRQALRVPVPLRRAARRILPRWILERVLPELRHVAKTEKDREDRGIPEPRR
jgi:hypothetical protein